MAGDTTPSMGTAGMTLPCSRRGRESVTGRKRSRRRKERKDRKGNGEEEKEDRGR